MEKAASLSRLQKLCSKAEYCSADIYRKALRDLSGDEAAAREIVDELIRDKYVDDARYALAFYREKSLIQGWGPVKIRFQLKGKGIPDALIDTAANEIDASKARLRLQKLIDAKRRSLKGDPQIRLKLLKYGLSRGYEYEEVLSCLVQE